MSKLITVEVAYALPDKQKIIEMQVEEGTTARQAVLSSGIDSHFPDVDLVNSRLGIFGQALGTKGLEVAERYQLQPRDRVEIYRPLIADPKEVRRMRAEKARQQRES